MACFEVIILKNLIKKAFYVKDGVNSNKKEGKIKDISLSLSLLNVKLLCRQQVSFAGHRSQVTGHCFTNTESIPNTCKS